MKKFPKILAFLALIVFVAACDTAQVQSLDELLNEEAGYLLRTKVGDSDEGGVAAGFAVLDSVLAV